MRTMNLKFYEEAVPNEFGDDKSYADVILYCNNQHNVFHVIVIDNQGRRVFDKENDYVNVAICYCNCSTDYEGKNGKALYYGHWIPLLEELFDSASYSQDQYEDLLELCECYDYTYPAYVEYCKGY